MLALRSIGAALCAAVAVTALTPPVLPPFFEADFTEFTAPTTRPPPYVNGVPPPPFHATRGRTFYDAAEAAMIEERPDYCIDIFPGITDTKYSCTFYNVRNASYFVSNNTKFPAKCCLFAKPFHPPVPTFLRTAVKAVPAGQVAWNDGAAQWWEVPSIPPPAGPFFYSFRDQEASPQVYSSFSFPGLNGWIQQNFHNVRPVRPPPSTWTLPDVCNGGDVPNCGFFGPNPPRV